MWDHFFNTGICRLFFFVCMYVSLAALLFKTSLFTGQRATEQPKNGARWSSRNFFPAGQILVLPDLLRTGQAFDRGILCLMLGTASTDWSRAQLLRSVQESLPPRQHLEYFWETEQTGRGLLRKLGAPDKKKGEESEVEDGDTEQRTSERRWWCALRKNCVRSSADTHHW